MFSKRKIAVGAAIVLFWCGFAGSVFSNEGPSRPVVFLPGIVGSELVGPNDIYWGDIGALRHFERLLIPDGPKEPNDGLRPTKLIDEVGVFGVTLVDQYSILRRAFAEVGFIDGDTYFEFPYDWRKSNFSTAEDLKEWISQHPKLKDAEFDLVGHSMGGLVAEIYVREHDPNNRVRRLVTLGTPLTGAVRAAGILDDGWGDLANWLAGGMPAIKSVVLSFPSIYELLPRHENCCAIGSPGNAQPFDILSTDEWASIDWREATPQNKDRVVEALASGRALGELLSSPMPSHVEVYRVLSTLFQTPHTIYFDPKHRTVKEIEYGQGDSVVAGFSAARSRDEVIDITTAKHQVIFDDDGFVGSLEIIFGTALSPPVDVADTAISARTKGGAVVSLDSLGIQSDKTIVALSSAAQVQIQISSVRKTAIDDLAVSLVLPSGDDVEAELLKNSYEFDPAAGELGRTSVEYTAMVPSPLEEGVFRFAVKIGEDIVARDSILFIDFEADKK